MATEKEEVSTPAGVGQLRIDVSALPSGLYFVRVGEKVGKFAKY